MNVRIKNGMLHAVECLAEDPTHNTQLYKKVLRCDPCSYCGVRGTMTLDHIVPRKKRGRDGVGNLTAACAKCNHEKAHYDLLTYLAYRAKIDLL